MKLFPLLAMLMFAAPVSAGEFTGSAYWYHSSTSSYAAPNHLEPLAGEFSIAYVGSSRLAPIGEINTLLKRGYRDRLTVEGVYYHAGVQFKVTDALTVEVKHGSWHDIDAGGRRELYNRVGFRAKLK